MLRWKPHPEPTTITISSDLDDNSAPGGLTLEIDPYVQAANGNFFTIRPIHLLIWLIDINRPKPVGKWGLLGCSPLDNGPPELDLDEGGTIAADGASTALILEQPSTGDCRWSGPRKVALNSDDIENSEVGIRATFLGQPGYTASKSGLVPFGHGD
jgi:hypothetical protein